MLRMMQAEWLKVRRSVIWLLLCVSPLMAAGAGYLDTKAAAAAGPSAGFPWTEMMTVMSVVHAMLFLPLLTGVFSALLCRYEHAGGGWKQLLSLPVTRSQVYAVKFLFVMGLLAAMQLIFLGMMVLLGTVMGGAGSIPWETLLASAGRGWLACLPLAALQLAVSTAWASFAAPLAVNVIFTMPNLLVVNSEKYAPYYPWAQPLLGMLPSGGISPNDFTLSMVTLFSVVAVSFVVFFACGWGYFVRKAV
ncbi:ABC transporter permease [Paenibacillus gansuensis]|uniref:ABC transporter permease n=1 Tax=Paenibacillus gansuensis TaxID=306542 RepID=A0ABW5PFQ8_9BACL